MPSVFFETFGCQMNVADSDALAAALAARGFTQSESPDTADLVVVNTCSVRERAEKRALARIAELAARKKRHNAHRQIWVTGCMAQRLGDSLKRDTDGIDRVIGARDVSLFVKDIDRVLGAASHGEKTEASDNRVSRFVPVMRGCDNSCAYCVVPLVRGPEVSLPAADVEAAVKSFVDKGACEVTLLGQNVNSYRDGATTFPALLRRVHAVEGLARIRFTTSHPKDCSEELIRTMAELPKVCRHVHLPVQSGCTRVLRLMNRAYTREQYLRSIDMIRRHLPNADITTDAMVGFPTETDQDFGDTLSLFEAVRFTAAFMFAYSKRDNTAAASMADDVLAEMKQERLRRLIELQTGITKRHYAAMIGKDLAVLITGRQDGRDGLWMGTDMGCKKVLATCKDFGPGMILPLRATRSTGMTLICERA
jgi:tRNA-2-methylthio-N6-dimethylallyladenosine synthase